ncbi:MAG TPA: TadE/TadG family type IV pilus assembly protein, partial [Streptosporangiaceae bacterium]
MQWTLGHRGGPRIEPSSPMPARKRRPTMKRRLRKGGTPDRGATVVEFALLLPVLLLMVFGIIDFGRALNAQVTITQAAREGARLDALNQPNVVTRTKAAATGLSASVTVAEVTTCPPGSGPTANADVRVTY